MVAGSSGEFPNSVTVKEKGTRNKRKLCADAPLSDPNKVIPPSLMDCPNYEFGKSQNNQSFEQNSVSNLCSLNQERLETFKSNLSSLGTQGPLGSGCDGSREEQEVEELQDADWSDDTENQLEELVLSNLDTIFKSAIKKITSCGYSEEVAMKAILRSGICYGCKDTVSNIVDNTLVFLGKGQEMDSSRDHFFENLQQLERYVLAEMVCVLQEVRPFFTTGDAMWCLLICDMNMSHACAMDGDLLSSDEITGSSSISTTSQLKLEANSSASNMHELDVPKPSKPSHSDELVKESPISSTDRLEESSAAGEECASTISRSSASHCSVLEEKPDGGRKGRTNSSRRESILRQKSIHLDKTYRAYGAKGALRSGKLSGLSSFFSDKKYKSTPDSVTLNSKNASLKISKAVGVDISQVEGKTNLSTSQTGGSTNLSIKPGPESVTDSKTCDSASGLPITSTELSLSLPSKDGDAARPFSNLDMTNCGDVRISSAKICGEWVQPDEVLLKLVPRVQELQTQLQEWTEWAQQKVMQVARRLNKEKAELKTLRQEKEEGARLKKEKQALEENTMKKLAEMESALCKASGQVERANAAVRRLEMENSGLRQEMEAAKLRAAESALNCQEVARREKKTLKKFQSWETQKALFQEELVTEKRRLSQLQQQLEQAREFRDQREARWRQEEKLKEEQLIQVSSERKEREQIEASAKSKEDMIRLKAESDFQRDRDEIRRLEKEISHLRLKTDSSKMAALRWGIDGTYTLHLADGKSIPSIKDTNSLCISEIDFQESGMTDVQRDRECVMCLTDEMSVVFLPCAHQVVCLKCNELHEKQGMKDCPSCRTPIQQRVCVRSADS